MSDIKFYDIRFTSKQMSNYNKAVHHLLDLSETPSFYEGIRDAFPGYRGSDDTLKKEIIDPIITSLGKIKISKKRVETDTKKITNFNKPVPVTPLMKTMIDNLASKKYDISEYYVDKDMTNSSKVRKIIKNYLESNNQFKDDKWTLSKNIKKEIPELIEDMKQKDKINKDGTIDQSNLNSCLIRISIQLCKV